MVLPVADSLFRWIYFDWKYFYTYEAVLLGLVLTHVENLVHHFNVKLKENTFTLKCRLLQEGQPCWYAVSMLPQWFINIYFFVFANIGHSPNFWPVYNSCFEAILLENSSVDDMITLEECVPVKTKAVSLSNKCLAQIKKHVQWYNTFRKHTHLSG